MERIYLDNAATTPLDKAVIAEMVKVMEDYYGNPSSIHAQGREVRTLIEKARKSVAHLLNAVPAEIFFTSGGTEADNTAIVCGVSTFNLKHVITSKIEHHAVEHTLDNLLKKGVIDQVSYVDIDEKGNIDYDHLERLLQQHPRSMVSLMHANNELGTLTDIERVGELCEQYDAIYHCDTVQTMGHYVHDVRKLKVHFLACAAHKLHGPKGVGFLYVNHNIKISPLIFGGAQERNMRGGTENVYGIVGLAKAFEIAHDHMEDHRLHIQNLKSYLINRLQAEIPGVLFNGEIDPSKSLYTVLNVSFPEMDMGDMLLFNLDINGISASGGSACSSGSNIGSHVLNEINANATRPSVRFSFSKHNTREELDYVVDKLKHIVEQNINV
ncbi:cysteine desulfurase [Pedobacter quisquiliarum]|jgi:cysteine desulfurase|uniref:cysteine desulfurase n=1 Tax=Pedobacter quisquiliarum TaxID=1834438 RepID=A0A916XGS0_9SPHI|nr:cysteine desulfurase family protein [Pedobacter quisquiliarum]GGC70849.1 cysteine desulfurase [Pedobacter quisquiliarum]